MKNMEDEEDARKDSGKGRKKSRVWRGTPEKELRMRLKKGEQISPRLEGRPNTAARLAG